MSIYSPNLVRGKGWEVLLNRFPGKRKTPFQTLARGFCANKKDLHLLDGFPWSKSLCGPRQNQTLVYSILLSYKCFLTFLGVSVDTLVEHRWHFCAKIGAIVQPVKVPESLFSVPMYPGFVLTPRSPVRSELIIYPWFIILTQEQYLTFLGCGGLPFLQDVILLCLHTVISIKSDHVTGDGLYSFQFHKQIQILK